MPQNSLKKKRNTWIKPVAILIVVLMFTTIMVISFTAFTGPEHIRNWDQLTEKDHDKYFVYYHIETSTTAQVLKSHISAYLEVSDQHVPIYYMNPQSVKGTPPEGINPEVPVQLIIVTDGEIEVAVDGPNAIARILQAAQDDTLKTYTPGHIIHWADLLYKGNSLYVLYIYEPDSEKHIELQARIDAFNAENPMNMTMYFMDKNASYGIPNDVKPNFLGIPLAVSNPTMVVRQGGENVFVAKGATKVIELLDSIDDESFSVE